MRRGDRTPRKEPAMGSARALPARLVAVLILIEQVIELTDGFADAVKLVLVGHGVPRSWVATRRKHQLLFVLEAHVGLLHHAAHGGSELPQPRAVVAHAWCPERGGLELVMAHRHLLHREQRVHVQGVVHHRL